MLLRGVSWMAALDRFGGLCRALCHAARFERRCLGERKLARTAEASDFEADLDMPPPKHAEAAAGVRVEGPGCCTLQNCDRETIHIFEFVPRR